MGQFNLSDDYFTRVVDAATSDTHRDIGVFEYDAEAATGAAIAAAAAAGRYPSPPRRGAISARRRDPPPARSGALGSAHTPPAQPPIPIRPPLDLPVGCGASPGWSLVGSK